MPQPLSRVRWKPGEIRFGADALRFHPDLAALAMMVVHRRAQIDAQVSVMFAYSIQATPLLGAKLLNSVESESARGALVKSAFRESLGEPALTLFSAIMKMGTKSHNARNDFAHGLWGVCDEVNDALILTDARYHAELTAGILDDLNRWIGAHRAPLTEKTRPDIRRRDLSRMFVYRAADFERLDVDATRVHMALKIYERLFPALGSFSLDQVSSELRMARLIPPEPETHTGEPTP